MLEVLLRVLNFDPWILYEDDLHEPTNNKYDAKIGWKPKEGIYIFPPKTADANSTTFTILKDGTRFNGKPINSQKLKLPSGKILKGEERKLFEIERIKLDVKLAELKSLQK